jgi:hypothetical protein
LNLYVDFGFTKNIWFHNPKGRRTRQQSTTWWLL